MTIHSGEGNFVCAERDIEIEGGDRLAREFDDKPIVSLSIDKFVVNKRKFSTFSPNN